MNKVINKFPATSTEVARALGYEKEPQSFWSFPQSRDDAIFQEGCFLCGEPTNAEAYCLGDGSYCFLCVWITGKENNNEV